jgi:hypothetical protein
MSRQSNADQLEGAIRAYVVALMDQREGRIAGGETVTTAQQNLRDALRAVLGTKESAA